MRYLSFTIENYRAISGPLTIDLKRRALLPVIGINESGKTTILHAILAFDHFNDSHDGGRHLKDTRNLYRTSSAESLITAEIETSPDELRMILTELASDHPEVASVLTQLARKRVLPSTLQLQRNLSTRKHQVLTSPFNRSDISDMVGKEIVRNAPYILFFDDFRDKVDEEILIDLSQADNPGGWLGILDQLFRATDSTFSVFALPGMEERQQKSVLAKVKRRLNATLTNEWQNFRLDDRDALELSIDLKKVPRADGGIQYYLKLDIVERDAAGDEHFFFITDRSKGFFWFFNFVMKLEFNPKLVSTDDPSTIYLLDEPGSYLHASAQSKLCHKLRSLSERNRVIYCTHSHYLLNPEVIPLSSIHVADKDGNGNISLVPIHRHRGDILEQRSAFQPVLDALRIRPFLMDLSHSRTIIVEGVFDYYALEMFRQNRPVGVLPSVGAHSIKFYISLLFAWQVDFRALWDADDAGRQCHAEAIELFGEDIAAARFRLLPCAADRKCIMQDLFSGEDLALFRRELDIADESSFEKTIAAVFFSSRRAELIARVSQGTRERFERLYGTLDLT